MGADARGPDFDAVDAWIPEYLWLRTAKSRGRGRDGGSVTGGRFATGTTTLRDGGDSSRRQRRFVKSVTLRDGDDASRLRPRAKECVIKTAAFGRDVTRCRNAAGMHLKPTFDHFRMIFFSFRKILFILTDLV